MTDTIASRTSPAPAKAAYPVMSIAQAHALLTAPGQKFEMEEIIVRGRKTRAWKNSPPTLRDIFLLARSFGEREFLVYEDGRATYEAFARASIALAHQMIADGVKKGDRVAIIMRNLPEFPVALFAAVMTGAIVTPLNAWWTAPELQYGLADSGARLVIVDEERLDRIEGQLDALPDLTKVYVARSPSTPADARIRRLEDIVGQVNDWGCLADRPLPDVALEPDDNATIFYTSGTTGKPKGALSTHRAITTNVLTSAIPLVRAALRQGEPIPDIDPRTAPQKVSLLVVPLFHVTGFNATLVGSMASGGKVVMMRRWEPELAMQLIERERVTNTGGVPTIAWQLIEHPNREKYDLSSLQGVAYGGAPSAPELRRKIEETFPGALAGNGWGMTETSGTFSTNVGMDYATYPDSCGPAIPVGEMRIMNPDGTGDPLPVGEVGELWVTGPNIATCYWNKPEASAETFVDGWLRTGDLARLNEEGLCFIIDRAKDMLIRGGENIYCVEVEHALYAHPDVMDAAVVGRPHRILGEEPVAVVHLKPGATPDEQGLRSFVAERLAAFKVPVGVLFWPETLPRNANGKIMKAELKKIVAEGAEAS
jgi:long-chain acyl-CoA synthetase